MVQAPPQGEQGLDLNPHLKCATNYASAAPQRNSTFLTLSPIIEGVTENVSQLIVLQLFH
jgi:hypothetical protein